MADDEQKLIAEAKKWHWADRLAHKDWKIRNDAYLDIAAACNSIEDPKDPKLKEIGEHTLQRV